MSFEEMAGSPVESFSEASGPTVVRRFLVPYAQRHTRIETMFNSLYPHFENCRVISQSAAPYTGERSTPTGPHTLDPLTGSNEYLGKLAVVTVNYGADFVNKSWPFPKPRFREGTELRYRANGGGEFYQIPASATKWEDDPETPVLETNETVQRISKNSIIVQWDYVDLPPLARFEGLTGAVNAGPFFGSPAETILFLQYEVSELFKARPSDPHTNRVSCTFERRAIPDGADVRGWNHDYREDPAGWVRLLKSDGNARYESKNLSEMFL